MGSQNPARDALHGLDQDTLGQYAKGDYTMQAVCRRPFCGHTRALHIPLLPKIFGPEATLGSIRTKFRSHRCGCGARACKRNSSANAATAAWTSPGFVDT